MDRNNERLDCWNIRAHKAFSNKLTRVISVLSTRAQLFKRWINLYPVDSAIATPNTYPLESDLLQRLNNHGQVSSCKTGKNVMTSSPSKKVIVLYIPYIVDHTQPTLLYIHDWMKLYDEYSHRNIHFSRWQAFAMSEPHF